MSNRAMHFPRPTIAQFALGISAMVVVVLASNYLVQFPLNDWLTWALGDLGVKLAVGVFMLLPFRLLIGRTAAGRSNPAQQPGTA